MSKMTPKQQRFIEEYLVDHNATQAAIRAGYSPRTAPVQASRLLTNANMQNAISGAGHPRRSNGQPSTGYPGSEIGQHRRSEGPFLVDALAGIAYRGGNTQ